MTEDINDWIRCPYCGSEAAALGRRAEYGGREAFAGYSYELHCTDCDTHDYHVSLEP